MSNYPFAELLRENVLLAPFTTLGIGGPARFMIEAEEEIHVLEALKLARSEGWAVFILGGGSNILVADEGFPGLVVHLASRGIRIEETGPSTIVTVAAGVPWDSFVEWCLIRNLSGVECLSGIPGTVGGTPIQNVGAYGQEVSEVIEHVKVLDREKLLCSDLSKADCGFSYRSSIFNTRFVDCHVVLSVTFALRSDGEPRLSYRDLQRFFAGSTSPPSLLQVREAVMRIRAEKAMILTKGDPDCRSAGSFFRNPTVSLDFADGLERDARIHGRLRDSEVMPRFSAGSQRVKIPAAWLIERSGFRKGYVRGRVGLSSKHTLAVINRGDASAREILDLMHEIQNGVRAAFGIDLAPEPVFVGF